MTSTPVSDAALYFGGISTKNQKATGCATAGESFSKVMNKTSVQNAGNPSQQCKTWTSEKNVSQFSKEGEKVQSGEKTKKDEKILKETPEKKTEELDETTGPDELKGEENMTETVKEELTKKAEELAEKIAEEFDVTTEDVEKILEELGISMMGLLNRETLTEIAVILSDANDATQIVMDEELFNKVNNLLQTLDEMKNMVSEEFLLTQEDLDGFISDERTAFDMQNTDLVMNNDENVSNASDENVENLYEVIDEGTENENTDTLKETEYEEKTVRVYETKEVETKEEYHENNHSFGAEGHENKFFTNIAENSVAENASLSAENLTDSYMTYEARELMQQVMDYIKVSVKPDMSSVQMQLHPEELGTLQIEVTSKNGVMTAKFTTQDEGVKTVMESQMVQLKENLNEQGIKVQAVEVAVASQQFDRNLDKNGNERNTEKESEKAGKKQIRRINLNEPDLEEQMQEEDDAVRIAADMMARNGNTIDFMA